MSLKLYQGWQTLRAAANVPDAGLFRLANSFLPTVPRWGETGSNKTLWREHAEKVAGANGGHIFLSFDVLHDGTGPRPGSAATRRARAGGIAGRIRERRGPGAMYQVSCARLDRERRRGQQTKGGGVFSHGGQ